MMRQIAATSRLVCTAAGTSRCNKTLVLGTQANLEEGKCELGDDEGSVLVYGLTRE